MEAIFLEPVLQEKIWGGKKLSTEFHLDIPSDKTGEAWVISAHPNGPSVVKRPEAYAGQTLAELYEREPQLFGPNHPEPFPLLVKILDANDNLSVQVHPDDAYAQAHEGPNELGKTECWYILSAEEGAKIIYGHNASTKEEFEAYVEKGDFDGLFREVEVKAGEFYDVPAGTIHAIGAGITILETQQSSDTTYRVFDYNRKDDSGKERELHLQQSIDVSLIPHQDSEHTKRDLKVKANELTELVANDYFVVYKLDVTVEQAYAFEEDYYLATVVKGSGEVTLDQETYPLKIADSFILPYGPKDVTFSGDMELVISKPVF
ncbi:mannose-6-phosphate isomerase, class I [Suicoccus acidiformans]|uniref:Mannose-6-phosphate isomerase n=1 Tax=Suicoccus acidiformans TaxID=2036206 RepID=A0A347WL22_9LACT|nr:mannose-6-phosphate isomerase, class I [Suicoccus acidiformans]AXY25779.1 mannose-6-phosphate isomerase, class I [Suicoccus acidiformans]